MNLENLVRRIEVLELKLENALYKRREQESFFMGAIVGGIVATCVYLIRTAL